MRIFSMEWPLRPGLIQAARLGVYIPRDSLALYQKQNSVFVVRDDKAVALPVRTLSVQDSEAVVLGDFLEGDLVVAKGQDRLFDGAAIIESKRLAKGDS